MATDDRRNVSTGLAWPVFDTAAVDLKLRHINSLRMKRATLKQEMHRHAQRVDSHHDEQRAAYLRRTVISDFRPDIEQEAARSLNGLAVLADRASNTLSAARTDLENKRQDYQGFRERNNLVREPHYPESVFRHVVLLILIALAETVLNGSMLSIGALGGLVQGWSIAFVIAVFNIGVAFALGNLIRLVNSKAFLDRTLGFLCAGLSIVVALLFNLFVAHYRSALLASEGFDESIAAGTRAWDSYSSGVFNVPDFMSWLLFGFGVLAAGFAAYKGYSLEDPYPGYSRRARAFKAAQDRFQDEYDDVIDELSQFQEDEAKQIDQHLQNLRVRVSDARESHVRASQLRARLASELAKLASDVEFLQAKHCPEEQPIRFQAILSGANRGAAVDSVPPPVEVDIEEVARLVRSKRLELSQRCAAVLERLRASAA